MESPGRSGRSGGDHTRGPGIRRPKRFDRSALWRRRRRRENRLESGPSEMKILYVNHYAGSLKHGMEYRPFYLAREWVRAGHEVSILAASHSHVRSVQPEVDGNEQVDIIDGIAYRWFRTPGYKGNGA